MSKSGYTDCRCRDCFEIAVSKDMSKPDFCNQCQEARCEYGSNKCKCQVEFEAEDESD